MIHYTKSRKPLTAAEKTMRLRRRNDRPIKKAFDSYKRRIFITRKKHEYVTSECDRRLSLYQSKYHKYPLPAMLTGSTLVLRDPSGGPPLHLADDNEAEVDASRHHKDFQGMFTLRKKVRPTMDIHYTAGAESSTATLVVLGAINPGIRGSGRVLFRVQDASGNSIAKVDFAGVDSRGSKEECVLRECSTVTNLPRLLHAGTDAFTGGRALLLTSGTLSVSSANYLDFIGSIPTTDTTHIGREVVRALAGMHAHGWLHHDIQPANIILNFDSAPYSVQLVDVGHAVPLGGMARPYFTAPFRPMRLLRLQQEGAYGMETYETRPADDYEALVYALLHLRNHGYTWRQSRQPQDLDPELHAKRYFWKTLAADEGTWGAMTAWLLALREVVLGHGDAGVAHTRLQDATAIIAAE